MDSNSISFLYSWKHSRSSGSKLVIIFTEIASDMIHMIMWEMLLSYNIDMMICSIHSWTHEATHICIYSYESSILFCDITYTCDKRSSRTSDVSTIFHENLRISELFSKNLIIFYSNAFCKDI